MKAAAPHFFNCKSAAPDNVTGEGTSHHQWLTLFRRTPDTRRRFNPTVHQTSGRRGYNTTRFYGFPGKLKARQHDTKRQEARSAAEAAEKCWCYSVPLRAGRGSIGRQPAEVFPYIPTARLHTFSQTRGLQIGHQISPAPLLFQRITPLVTE